MVASFLAEVLVICNWHPAKRSFRVLPYAKPAFFIKEVIEQMGRDELPEIMVMNDVIRFLRISRAKAYDLSKAPGFPSFRIWGRSIRIRKDRSSGAICPSIRRSGRSCPARGEDPPAGRGAGPALSPACQGHPPRGPVHLSPGHPPRGPVHLSPGRQGDPLQVGTIFEETIPPSLGALGVLGSPVIKMCYPQSIHTR